MPDCTIPLIRRSTTTPSKHSLWHSNAPLNPQSLPNIVDEIRAEQAHDRSPSGHSSPTLGHILSSPISNYSVEIAQADVGGVSMEGIVLTHHLGYPERVAKKTEEIKDVRQDIAELMSRFNRLEGRFEAEQVERIKLEDRLEVERIKVEALMEMKAQYEAVSSADRAKLVKYEVWKEFEKKVTQELCSIPEFSGAIQRVKRSPASVHTLSYALVLALVYLQDKFHFDEPDSLQLLSEVQRIDLETHGNHVFATDPELYDYLINLWTRPSTKRSYLLRPLMVEAFAQVWACKDERHNVAHITPSKNEARDVLRQAMAENNEVFQEALRIVNNADTGFSGE